MEAINTDERNATCVVSERWLTAILHELGTLQDANARLADRLRAMQLQVMAAEDKYNTITRLLSENRTKRKRRQSMSAVVVVNQQR